jgi:hypothetical protein
VGVRIDQFNASAAGNNLANIDLGTPADPGHNVFHAALASNPNINAGLCVEMGALVGAQTLKAAGNTFAGPRDCSTATPGALTANGNNRCLGRVDIGVRPNNITADVAACTVP